MSEVEDLEKQVEAAHEFLFGILMMLGQPVVVDLERLKVLIEEQDTMIDASLNKDDQTVTLSLVKISG